MTGPLCRAPLHPPRAAFRQLLATEARIAWRVPVGLILGVAASVVVLIVLGYIPGMSRPAGEFGGLTWFGVYLPNLLKIRLPLTAKTYGSSHPPHRLQRGVNLASAARPP